MELFLSSACLSDSTPLLLCIDELMGRGVLNIELGAGLEVPEGPFPVRELLARAQARFLVHNYFPPPADPFMVNLASLDAAIRNRSLALVRNALRLAAQLKAPFYSIHAGCISDPIGRGNGGFVFAKPNSVDEVRRAMDRFVDCVNSVLPEAEQLGIGLLVENNVCGSWNRGKLLLQSADEFLELFARCPSPSLGMLLDTGHLNVSAVTFGFDRVDAARRVARFVRALHVHDNDGTVDQHQPIEGGSWVMEVLRDPAFASCHVVIEARFVSAEVAVGHLNWLRDSLSDQPRVGQVRRGTGK